MTIEQAGLLALPLAGYPVPETVATREHSLHCFACGGALSHSCSCVSVKLHRDALASLIYWVQHDTVDAIKAALASSGPRLDMEATTLVALLRRFEEVYTGQRGMPWIGTVRPEQAFGRAADALAAMDEAG